MKASFGGSHLVTLVAVCGKIASAAGSAMPHMRVLMVLYLIKLNMNWAQMATATGAPVISAMLWMEKAQVAAQLQTAQRRRELATIQALWKCAHPQVRGLQAPPAKLCRHGTFEKFIKGRSRSSIHPQHDTRHIVLR